MIVEVQYHANGGGPTVTDYKVLDCKLPYGKAPVLDALAIETNSITITTV